MSDAEYMKAYHQAWREVNGERRAHLARKSREEARLRAVALKGGRCVDCGLEDFRVLEFDHLGDKECNVGALFGKRWSRVEVELKKCELVCSNCHAIRTYERGAVRWVDPPREYRRTWTKDHCPKGHPKTPENRYHWNGKSLCRPCRTEDARRRRGVK